jgi:hypothetical protein
MLGKNKGNWKKFLPLVKEGRGENYRKSGKLRWKIVGV